MATPGATTSILLIAEFARRAHRTAMLKRSCIAICLGRRLIFVVRMRCRCRWHSSLVIGRKRCPLQFGAHAVQLVHLVYAIDALGVDVVDSHGELEHPGLELLVRSRRINTVLSILPAVVAANQSLVAGDKRLVALALQLQVLDLQLGLVELALVARARALQAQLLHLTPVQLTLLGAQLLLAERLLLSQLLDVRRLPVEPFAALLIRGVERVETLAQVELGRLPACTLVAELVDAIVGEIELVVQIVQLVAECRALVEVETHEVVSVHRAATLRTLTRPGHGALVQPLCDARRVEDVAALARRNGLVRLETLHANGALGLHSAIFFSILFYLFIYS